MEESTRVRHEQSGEEARKKPREARTDKGRKLSLLEPITDKLDDNGDAASQRLSSFGNKDFSQPSGEVMSKLRT